jgi:tetratricopeptide (TPR) repeat protein
LATAGSYLHQVSTSFAEYRQLYQASWARLQETSPRLSSYDRTLYSSWQISFARVKQRNKVSAKLLRLWAFFDNQDLWFELLQHGDSANPEWIRELARDKLNFNVVVRVLCDHGLVEADYSRNEHEKSGSQHQIESRGYNMHGCVHSWVRAVLNQERHKYLGDLALKLVASHVPDWSTIRRWQIGRRLLHHAARCADFVSNVSVSDCGKEWELQQLGILFSEQDKLEEAESFLQRSLHACLEVNMPNNTLIPDTQNQLGLIYLRQGDQQKAGQTFQCAIQRYEQALGPEDVSKLCPLINVGTMYMDQGRLEEATELFNLIWRRYDEAYGPHNRSSSMAICNLGLICKRKGEYDEAERLLQLGLQGYEAELGPDHDSTIKVRSDLGTLYLDQDKLEDAERMYQQVAEGYERTLGMNHTSTINAVDLLGITYARQKKLDEAEKSYQKALERFEETLGPDHLMTLGPAYRLGHIYEDQNRLSDAAAMFRRAWQGYEKELGPSHVSTLKCIDSLGSVNAEMGNYDEAVQLLEQARHGYDTASDTGSPLWLIQNLGHVYRLRGELDKSEEIYQQILQCCEATDCPDCDTAKNALCNLEQIYKQRFDALRQENPYHRRELKHCIDSIVAVTSLCENYGKIWPSFLNTLARALLLVGRAREASCAFHYYSHLVSDPEALDIACNECLDSITARIEWHVCILCKDVDLCSGCYRVYQVQGILPGELMEGCRDHSFITVSGRTKDFATTDSSSLDSFLELWLTSFQIWCQTLGEER